jgi:ATP-dependent helicase/nuclease subunit B
LSLQFIIGNSGSGKTTEVLNRVIRESLNDPMGHYLIIVPEQFTMQTQRDAVRLHPRHSCLNIEILSFLRLSYRVFGELGTPINDVLGDTGKNLVLRKIAEENSESLVVLNNSMKKSGYINEIRSFISELSQYGIDPDGLLEIGEVKGFPDRFRMKVGDIEKLYSGFKNFIDGNFITAEEIPERLTEVADRSELLKNCTLVFDGFTGFTPVQKELLRKLIPLSKKTYVTITMDGKESYLTPGMEQELFFMSKNMSSGLVKLCEETGTKLDEPIILPPPIGTRFRKNACLFFLEENIFRENGTVFSDAMTDTTENEQLCIYPELYRLRNFHDEMEFVASYILNEVRENKRKFSDIAVVCSSVEEYSYTATSIFKKYEIPIFLDAKSKITGHPFLAMIKRLFIMLQYNFRPEDVMKYLKCGMGLVPERELDDLDYYISVMKPRGYKNYSDSFKRKNKTFTEDVLMVLNEEKELFMKPVREFSDLVKKNDLSVREISDALRTFFENIDAQNKLLERAEHYAEIDEPVLKREYENIYDQVIELLEQMDNLLGDNTTTPEEYYKIISSGFDSIKIGMIPPSNDCVIFGDIERTRLDNVKVLILTGACDGMIPKADTRQGILSALERERLKEEGFELAPTARERAFRQRYYLYLCLTKPSEKLVITAAGMDKEGKSRKVSYLYQEMIDMFPGLEIKENVTELLSKRITTDKSVREKLILLLSKKINEELDSNETRLLSALLKYENVNDREFLADVLNNLFYRHIPEKLKDDINSRLVKNNLKGSVSKLETYAKCPYGYFLKYLLRLNEWEEDDLSNLAMGNYYHYVLKRYSDHIKDRNLKWHDINDNDMESILEKSMDEITFEEKMDRFKEDPATSFKFEEVKNTLRVTVPLITRQVKKGSFEPEGFEVDFREVQRDIPLESLSFPLENSTMEFTGKIDRLDTYTSDDGKIMVKISDYKTGNHEIKATETFGGISIQLFLYMDAALEMEEKKTGLKAVPAGVFYVRVNGDPGNVSRADYIKANDTATEDEPGMEVAYKITAKDGLINSDDNMQMLLGMDKKPGSGLKPIDDEQWKVIRKSIRGLITEEGNKMSRGEIDCEPYSTDNADGCKNCSYHSICHFDPDMDGYNYRELKKISDFNIKPEE